MILKLSLLISIQYYFAMFRFNFVLVYFLIYDNWLYRYLLQELAQKIVVVFLFMQQIKPFLMRFYKCRRFYLLHKSEEDHSFESTFITNIYTTNHPK